MGFGISMIHFLGFQLFISRLCYSVLDPPINMCQREREREKCTKKKPPINKDWFVRCAYTIIVILSKSLFGFVDKEERNNRL